MSTEHVIDQLSAFLDGEAEDPEAVAAHLRRCAVCQRHYLELRAMALTLHKLPAPDVAPAFTTRIMANVREAAPPRGWHAPVAIAWSGAAVAALIVAAVVTNTLRPPATTAPPAVSLAEIEERLWNELASRAETGDIETALAAYDADGALSGDDLLAMLAEEDWFDELVEEVYATAESADLLRSLDTAEVEVFNSLVVSTLGKG